MSTRAEKGDAQIRKPGRPGSSRQHRGFSGSGGGGMGGGGGGPGHPHLSSSTAPGVPALSTSRSFNKSGNGQGAKARVSPANPISEPSSATVADHTAARKTPPKGDASKSSTLQFGTTSHLASANADEGIPLPPDAVSNKSEVNSSQDVGFINPGMSSLEMVKHPASISSEVTQKLEGKVTELSAGNPVSDIFSGPKVKPSSEPARTRTTVGKKKKRKEILSKLDSFKTAYKGPGQKQEIASTSGNTDGSLTVDAEQVHVDIADNDAAAGEEDATEISTPKLKTSGNTQLVHGANKNKYSRDILLNLAEQCTELPVGFEIGADIALMSGQAGTSREPHPSPGRITDRHSAGMRGDRRMGGMMDDGKWIKSSGSSGPGVDTGHVPAVMIPSPHTPHTPLQSMHRAEKKYEVGKVSDMEETKQRQLKAILNKLTPRNFEKLFAQVTEVNIDNAVTLTGVISQIFDRALMEPTFCEMYANFCFHLAGALPDFSEDNEKITFSRLLLNKCQEEFERGEREQAEANKVEGEGEIKQSEEEREQKRIRARRRMLGNIRLIGELYKKKMLTERIMHECIKKLLGQHQNPKDEDIEALCNLMSTIGEMIDHAEAKEHMDAYFDIMHKLSTHPKLSSCVRLMLRDSIDLRKNKWINGNKGGKLKGRRRLRGCTGMQLKNVKLNQVKQNVKSYSTEGGRLAERAGDMDRSGELDPGGVHVTDRSGKEDLG